MTSASASTPILPPVEERLATAIANRARLEREVKDLQQEKIRLRSRTDAAGLNDDERADAMAECQSRLDAARRQFDQEMTMMVALETTLSKTVAQRQETQTQPAPLQSAPVSHTLYRALRSGVKADIPSPSRSDKSLLVAPFAHFMAETPLMVKTDLSPAEYAALGERPDTYSAGLEAAYIREALQYLPVGTRVVGKGGASGKMSAKRLFPAGSRQSVPFVRLPWSCFPELAVRSDRGYPGFSGELKPLPPVSWNEALTYVTMSMLDSLFPASEPHDVYHFRPPTGYALMAMAGCGFFSAVEWVARLFIGPITSSFNLGSEQHKAAVDKLDIVKVKRWVELNVKQSVESSTYPADAGEDAAEVIWSTSPAELRVQSEVGAVQLLGNRFVKIITHKAFSHLSDRDAAYQFRHLHRVYAMYAELFEGASADGTKDRPPALVSARLLYGAFSVLVDMPFVDGRPATDEELDQDGPVLQQLAAAIAWLAHRGLLYCDLRVPNVLVVDKQGEVVALLVDYDDMVIVTPGTVRSTDALVEAVRENAAKHGLRNCAANVGGRPALRRLLDEALLVYEDGG